MMDLQVILIRFTLRVIADELNGHGSEPDGVLDPQVLMILLEIFFLDVCHTVTGWSCCNN